MPVSVGPVTRPDLPEFLTRGLSLAVVTRDDRMVVEVVRCGAARIGADGRVWLALPMPEGKRSLANISSTRAIALSAAYPLSYQTVQLKGADATPVDWPALQQATREHREQFGKVLRQLGTERATDALWSPEFVAVAFTPSEFYDQTPGPAAGLALDP